MQLIVGETSSSASFQEEYKTLQVARQPSFFYTPGHPGLRFMLLSAKVFPL